ncbi:MAG: tetratricopeptide repeat protein [Actinomycetota bacterium]|nr:tetratricopeptide repeat protein [Actinomycetota bacterium]
MGWFDEALDHLQKARAAWREIDDRWGEGWTLFHLGNTYRDLGRFDEALDHYQQALVRGREMGAQLGEAWALHSLGTTYRGLGRLDEALDHYQQALKVRREMGSDRWGEGQTLDHLGEILHRTGQSKAARASWLQALTIFEELRDPQAADVRARLETLNIEDPDQNP